MLKALLIVVAIGGALYGLHQLALWMERKGWIFYKHTKATGSSMSNAFQTLQAIWEPRAEHVVNQRYSDEKDEEESGDPPRDDLRLIIPPDAGTGSGRGLGSSHAETYTRANPDTGPR